jgi:GTP-binding protein
VYDHPGTTRDSIAIDFERHNKKYTIVDTAGIRRKGKITELVEKFSVIKTLDTLTQVDVAIIILDATEGVLDQDCHVIQAATEKGVGVILALNKWDGLSDEQKLDVKNGVERKLQFIRPSVDLFTISAKHGTGVGLLFDALQEVYEACYRPIGTTDVNAVLKHALETHQPPMVKGHRIKCRYAHLGGRRPLRIVIHGNQVDRLPESYKRYLYKMYREAFKLKGVTLELVLKPQENPFSKD